MRERFFTYFLGWFLGLSAINTAAFYQGGLDKMDPLQEIFFTYFSPSTTRRKSQAVIYPQNRGHDTPKKILANLPPKGIELAQVQRERKLMDLLTHLPYLLWWLLIIALSGFGIFTIGLALISLIVERDEARK